MNGTANRPSARKYRFAALGIKTLLAVPFMAWSLWSIYAVGSFGSLSVIVVP